MSLATHSPSLQDGIKQVSTASEQNPSEFVKLGPTFADTRQIQDSSAGLFANAHNVLITGGTSVVVSDS